MYKLENADASLLRKAVDLLKAKIKNDGIFFLSTIQSGSAYFACGTTANLAAQGVSADTIMKSILPLVGGSGGGRKDFAQGGTKDASQVQKAFKEAERIVRELV